MRELKRSRKFETVDDSLYDMSGDEYTKDEEYMNDVHPKVVSWFKNFTKSSKLWNGVEKRNIAIIENIADSEVVPEDIVDDCNNWVDSEYFYSLGYLDYDIIDLCKEFLSTYRYPTNENKTMRELKRSRRIEGNRRYYESLSNSDVKEIMDNLREQNTSNKLDNDNFRLSEALNLFQKLLDEKDKGYPYNSDLDVFYKFKKAGYKSASDLISDITGAVNRRIRELTQVKNELEELKHIAISFDIRPGHH